MEEIGEENNTRLCTGELFYPDGDNNGRQTQKQREEWVITLLVKRVEIFGKFKDLYDTDTGPCLDTHANKYLHLKDSFDRNFIAIVSSVQKLCPDKMSLYFSKDFDYECIKFNNLLQTVKVLRDMLIEDSVYEITDSESMNDCIEGIQNLIDDDKYRSFAIGKYGFVTSSNNQ